MAALMDWPRVPDYIGPDCPAVWNRLSVLQVETVIEAGREGMRPSDIAGVVDAALGDVVGCLRHHGLYREPA